MNSNSQDNLQYATAFINIGKFLITRLVVGLVLTAYVSTIVVSQFPQVSLLLVGLSVIIVPFAWTYVLVFGRIRWTNNKVHNFLYYQLSVLFSLGGLLSGLLFMVNLIFKENSNTFLLVGSVIGLVVSILLVVAGIIFYPKPFE